MGYLKIPNLYKSDDILQFKSVYALEKVHGTSAHISYFSKTGLHFHSGGEKHDKFVSIFDKDMLLAKFQELELTNVTVFGEAYGGKMQGMSRTYGKENKFIAFDVRIDDVWLDVEKAAKFVNKLGLQFVPYQLISTDITALEVARDAYSQVAFMNGMGNDKIMEGIVLRPPFEVTLNNGQRLIAKFKRKEFQERVNEPNVQDPEKLKILEEANKIADEWVTNMRLTHVLDKLSPNGAVLTMNDMPKVLDAMYEDIAIEAKGEIVETKELRKKIGHKTAEMFKKKILV